MKTYFTKIWLEEVTKQSFELNESAFEKMIFWNEIFIFHPFTNFSDPNKKGTEAENGWYQQYCE